MVAHTISAGTFAVFTHRGPISGIGDTCREIYQQWLPASRYAPGDIADIEVYSARFNPESDESEMEYWVSVIPKPVSGD